MKILYVEDDPSSIRVLNRLAQWLGHELVVSQNVSDAEALTDSVPDLILTTIQVSDIDELTAIHRLRARYGDIPIIVTTIDVHDVTRERCLEAGSSDYIERPYQIPALIELIRRYEPQRLEMED